MGATRIEGVRIAGLVSAVPDHCVTIEDDERVFGRDEMRRVARNTGVTQRVVAENLCTSDLCVAAADHLLAGLGWAKDSIDVLVFVTQTPDYPSPATACLIQNRLGISRGVAAFDVNLGCSGYTYGLWLVASLLSAGKLKRALLLAGDVVSRAAAPQDRAVVPLFGDAGTATALEFSAEAPPLFAQFGSDGQGGVHLHTLAGGMKHPTRHADLVETLRQDGVCRTNQHTYMNGPEVLAFAIQSVPTMVRSIHEISGWSEQDVDHYVFHQASEFMLKNIARCSRLPSNKVVMALQGYGNTSSASIPLAISARLVALRDSTMKLVLGGFGIGWSWCALAAQVGPLYLPEVLRIPDVAIPGEMESLEAHQPVAEAKPA